MRLLLLASVFIDLASLFAAPADVPRGHAQTIAPFRLPDPRTDKLVDLMVGWIDLLRGSRYTLTLLPGVSLPCSAGPRCFSSSASA